MTAITLTFQNTTFDIIERTGQVWLRAVELAQALGYADQSSVNRIYARNADEFTDGMTASVKLTDPKGDLQESRIFSLRGCHLIAMFARTAIAKQFRKWVLDVLDKETAQAELPTPPQNPHLTLTQTIKGICKGNRQHYSALYNRLYRKFQVTSYKELNDNQCVAAIEFIKSLEGEYIPRDKIEAQKPTFALADGQHYIVVKDGEPLYRYLLSSEVTDSCLKTMGIGQDKFAALAKDLAQFCAPEDPHLQITYPTAQRTLSLLSALIVHLENHGFNMALMYQKTQYVQNFLTNYYSRLEAIHYQMNSISKQMSLDAINYAADICKHPTVVSCYGAKIA